MERQVGAALHEKYGVKADMKNFAVCVRVDVVKKKKGKKRKPHQKQSMACAPVLRI